MGFLREVFVGPERGLEARARHGATSSLENPSSDLVEALTLAGETSYLSAAGISVTPETALRMVAVYACVRVLAEGVASFPLHLLGKAVRGKRRLTDEEDPRVFLLEDEPNPEMDAFRFWELTVGHANLWGNAYHYNEVSERTGLTRALWPLRPDRTSPVRLESGARAFVTYLDSGEPRILLPDEVVHYPAFGTGDVGISPIGVARQAVGLAIAAEEYAGRFYANDGRPGGVIQVPGRVSDKDFSTTLKRWKNAHQGLEKSHLVGILDNGAEWKDVGIPPQDVAFLETRKFQRLEVASLYRVPPRKIGIAEGQSFASAEQDAQDFITDSLQPWTVRLEKALKRAVFSSVADRAAGLSPKFKLDALLRGTTLERYQAHAVAVQNGWKSRADVREDEDLPFVEGLDDYLSPQGNRPSAAGDSSGAGGGGDQAEAEPDEAQGDGGD